MYNNGNSSKNVTGSSVVDGTMESADFPDNGLSGDKIDGGIISNFQSTGIDDRLPTGKVLTLSATGVDVTGSVSSDQAIVANDVTSTGITGAQASYGVLVNAATGSGKYSHGLGFIAGTIAGAGIGSYDGGSGGRQDMWFATRSQYNVYAEKARISHDGYFRLATGGIQFNGDTAAANALDDYEEGTWTATWTDSVLGAIDGGTAAYTKVGNKVTVSAHFSGGSANVSPSGTLSVTGFPFASKNASWTRYTGILKARKLASAVTKSIHLPYASSIAYVTDGSTEVGTLSTTAMYTNGSTNERIGFSLTYFTD